MSIDDELIPWRAHEALERGENPSGPLDLDARRAATASLTTLLLRDGGDRWLSEHHAEHLAKRLVAHALLVRGYLAPMEEGDRTVLRQQPANSYDDQDSILERLHELKAEEDLLNGYLRSMRSPYAPPEYEPDDRGEREDIDRARVERQDEAAEMPRVAS